MPSAHGSVGKHGRQVHQAVVEGECRPRPASYPRSRLRRHRQAQAAERSSTAVPSGTPIKVMTEAPVDSPLVSYPNIPGAAKVYAQWINAHGGIAGHPLQVITCDDRADAAEAASCARKAAAAGVVANVGSFTLDASRAIPILEKAKIAWFGVCCTLVAQETSSKISFPMGCLLCFPPAAAIKMVDDGCKHIVEVYGDLPSTPFLGLGSRTDTSRRVSTRRGSRSSRSRTSQVTTAPRPPR